MQTYSSNGVRQERTGWRDKELSERHRHWGFDCPVADVDFLLVEYNHRRPSAIVEYKHFWALSNLPEIRQGDNYQPIRELADQRTPPLPFFIAVYWPVRWAFRVYPANRAALKYFRYPYEDMTERQFVSRLYRIRGTEAPPQVLSDLKNVLPPRPDKTGRSNGRGQSVLGGDHER